MLAYIRNVRAGSATGAHGVAVGGQRIGRISVGIRLCVQRLPGAFLRQPVQHMGPEAAMRYIRILLLKEGDRRRQNHRLFSPHAG